MVGAKFENNGIYYTIGEFYTASVTSANRDISGAVEIPSQVEYNGEDPLVKSIYAGTEGGWVVEVIPSGFGGELDMVVGISPEGVVTGVSIISMSETSGLGANAMKESFRSQYAGKSGVLAVSKDGGQIDALTGATITSRAVTNGVNAALSAVADLS